MDITTVFGTVVPGSSPGGSTKRVYEVWADECARGAHAQDSKTF